MRKPVVGRQEEKWTPLGGICFMRLVVSLLPLEMRVAPTAPQTLGTRQLLAAGQDGRAARCYRIRWWILAWDKV